MLSIAIKFSCRILWQVSVLYIGMDRVNVSRLWHRIPLKYLQELGTN